ncbi:MAG: hypothetical protein JHD16_01605 [Solirubrobacteraceae bacterium]|nr:hypothetical protein [Solirubrobacteraceae bacterium]
MTALLRNLDLLLLGVALPVFLVAGFPMLGWLTAAVIWIAWRAIGEWTDRKARDIGTSNPGKFAGIAAGSMIGRGWMMGLILITVGLLTNDETGLSAALLCVVLFTSSFVVKLISRPTHQASPAS